MKHLMKLPVSLCLALLGIGIGAFLLRARVDVGNVDAVEVEARGSNRAWRFSYPGPDGRLGTPDDRVSEGQLTLPVGAEVVLRLRSEDFIYVFSCPDLKLKEIAVPDLKFALTFQVDRVGAFDLAMDPMCGFVLPPGKTMGTLTVAPERDFHRWLETFRPLP